MVTTVHTTPYGSVASVYDAFMTLTGFKRGVENFLNRVELNLPPQAKILDAGCGTGLVALYLAHRYPDATIFASDIDREMLKEMKRIADREAMSKERIISAENNLATPDRLVRYDNGEAIVIQENSLDAIFVSGALEHVPLTETIQRLQKLLKPGGIFLNLGLRRSPTGAMLAMMYHCRPYKISEMRHACERAHLDDIRVIQLTTADFPANLSRVAITARKIS